MNSHDNNRELTDRLFGELSGEQASGVDRRRADDPALDREYAELESFSGRLRRAFGSEAESAPSLGDSREKAVLRVARTCRKRGRDKMEPWVLTLCLSAAAAVVAGTFLPFLESVPLGQPVDEPVEYSILPAESKSLDPVATAPRRRPVAPQSPPGAPWIPPFPVVGPDPGALELADAILRQQTEVLPDSGVELLYSRPVRDGESVAAGEGPEVVPGSYLERPYRLVANRPVVPVPLPTGGAAMDALDSALRRGELPQPAAVPVQELVGDAGAEALPPGEDTPIRIVSDLHRCPWNADTLLARIWVSAPGIDGSADGRVAAEWASGLIEFNPRYIAAYRILATGQAEGAAKASLPALPRRLPLRRGDSANVMLELLPSGHGAAIGTRFEAVGEPVFEPAAEPRPSDGEHFRFTLLYRPQGASETAFATRTHSHAPLPYAAAGPDFKTAAAAALLGAILEAPDRAEPHLWNKVVELASEASSEAETSGKAARLLDLAAKARTIALGRQQPVAGQR
jgi:hypothetical protein